MPYDPDDMTHVSRDLIRVDNYVRFLEARSVELKRALRTVMTDEEINRYCADVGAYTVQDVGAGDWMPEDTAPDGKDHPYAKLPGQVPATFLLVWNGHHCGVGYCDDERQWWSETGEPIEPKPTHWMLRPPPPSEALKSKD